MNCDVITMATCMLLEGEDSVPPVCYWASVSEPHIDEFAVNFPYNYIFIYIWCTSCRKSLLALILRVLASFGNSKNIHKV